MECPMFGGVLIVLSVLLCTHVHNAQDFHDGHMFLGGYEEDEVLAGVFRDDGEESKLLRQASGGGNPGLPNPGSNMNDLPPENQTSLAEEDFDKLLYLEYGNYTTQTFHYANAQDLGKHQEVDYCYDDYMRCITSITVPNSVCGWFNAIRWTGTMRVKPSYCDIYFENCKLGYRRWRVLGYGACYFLNEWEVQGIEEVRRKNDWLAHYYQRRML